MDTGAVIRTTKIRFDDNGPGVPKSFQEKLFGRFEGRGTIHGKKGLGIGLYLARAIIEYHGGHIFALDNPRGVGSRFQIEIPRVPRITEPFQYLKVF